MRSRDEPAASAQGFTVGERTGTLREGSDVPVYEIEMGLEREGPEEPEER